MLDESKLINVQVKDNEVHVERKDPEQQIKKEFLPTSLEVQQRAAHARTKATSLGADLKREISMEIRNKLSESFDFIEESCGSGSPEFEFYAEPKMVSEGVEEGAPSYPIIGRASGVFAPIGVMSRNNRIYDNDHYDYLLENQQLVDRIAHRGMLGTIGHHDKKVDDQDLAEGKVSHIVTNLRIVEEADGSRNLYGTLEILDTPAGHLLKTYYDSGVPLFVSSRGGGNLLPVPNESYKRVDKTKYFLETFDIVKNPGFLQAKPVYEKVSESVEETIENQTEEIVEEVKSEDKLDKLIESVSSLVTAISEGDKKVVIKQEDDEKKETKETKEAKEAKETKIVEEKKDDKKDKEEDKPEDEKNDEAESAAASSVTEEEKKQELSPKAQKFVKKVLDPNADLSKKEIASGKYEQLKTVSPEEAHQMGVSMDKADAERKAMIKELRAKAKANPKPSTSQSKEEAKQLPLFCSKEELINKLRSAIADYNLDEELEKDGPKGEVKPLKSAPKTGYFDKKIETAKTNFRTKDKVARNAWKNFNPDDIDYSGYSDSYANAMTADDERQEALDNYKYTRDKMNAERKGKALPPKDKYDKNATEREAKPKRKSTESEMKQIQRIRDSKEQGIRMNDKNSKIEQALKTIDETIEDTIDKTVKDKNKRQELHNKAMLNKHVELIHAADRRAEHFKGDPKYNTERNQTFTQASPYNDAYDQINRNRFNKNSYEDSKRQERGSDSDRIYRKIVKRANEINHATPQQKASAGKMNYMKGVNRKIDEADQVLAQPIVAVQNTGNSTKSAQEANPEVKEPVTMDRLELARALKAKVNNGKKVEV